MEQDNLLGIQEMNFPQSELLSLDLPAMDFNTIQIEDSANEASLEFDDGIEIYN